MKGNNNCQVFTPFNIVTFMLNKVGYKPLEDLSKKHIIDNSCGNGNFLIEIVKRYIASCDLHRVNKDDLKRGLEKYIHGVEIDGKLCSECVHKLDKVAGMLGIKNIKWDIRNEDAFDDISLLSQMDYVVGNPPYIKVHNLTLNERDKYKKYCNLDKGAIDLYVAFFDLGTRMLRQGGKLIYITPNTWINNIAARKFRKWIIEHKSLISIIDNGSSRIFKDVSVYTMITLLSRSENDKDVIIYDAQIKNNIINLNERCSGNINNFIVDQSDYKLCFEADNNVNLIKGVNSVNNNYGVQVRNGFATLCDKLFIVGRNEEEMMKNEPHIIPCVKASKNIQHFILFPYNINDGSEINYDDLSGNEKKMLHDHINKYGINIKQNKWWLYGRSQALNDVKNNKIGINWLLKDINSIKLCDVPSGVGIYGGYYILYEGIADASEIRKILLTEEFINYVKLLKRYKNGGYYTFNTRELEHFINYKLNA